MKKPTLSIVITAHHEGLLAHKTMLSIFAAADKIKKEPYEIIINLDKPDVDTRKYFARYKKDPRFTINTTSFGEPSAARNAAIQLARGKYITILDGDDLLSSNFFSEFFALANEHKGEKFVVHPGATVQFGEHIPLTAWPIYCSTDTATTTYGLVSNNLWMQCMTAPAEVLKSIPYPPATHGFGYEDWWWNSETFARGYPHYVTDTVLFYRRKTGGGVQDLHNAGHTTLPYTTLLETARVQSLPLPPITRKQAPMTSRGKNLIKRSAKFCYKAAIALPIVKIPTLAVARRVEKRMAARRFTAIPEFLRRSWQDIATIEPIIKYSEAAAEHICFQSYVDSYPGIVYRHLIEHISTDQLIDRIYMVGSRMSSFARATIRRSIERDQQRHPDWHIVVLADIGMEGIPGVDFIKFSDLTRSLTTYEKDRIFSRFIIQSRAKSLIVAESRFFLGWIRDHRELLESNGYSTVAMVFDKTYVDPDLINIYPIADKIMTSNYKVIDFLVNQQAFDPAKIKAIDDAAEN